MCVSCGCEIGVTTRVAGPPTQPIHTYLVQVRDGVLGVEL